MKNTPPFIDQEEAAVSFRIKSKDNLSVFAKEINSNYSLKKIAKSIYWNLSLVSLKIKLDESANNSRKGTKNNNPFYIRKHLEEEEFEVDQKSERKRRIFWTKEKLENFREKCKDVKEKILQKTKNDFNEVRNAITDKDVDRVKKIMLDENFKDFYKLELRKSSLLEYMLSTGQVELLMQILEDSFYKFDKNFIFSFILKKLKSTKDKIIEDK